MALIFWAPVPLKFTVLGPVDVVFKVPAVIVIVLAIPIIELAASCNDIPLIMVLKRFAVPLNEEVPVKVTEPADADKLPLTERVDDIEKLALVVIEPVTDNSAKPMVPAPDIVFKVPLIVIVPLLAEKLPDTDKLPVRSKEVAVLTLPEMLRLSSKIPLPLMVFPEPVILNIPPEAWLNEPDEIVARFPDKVMFALEKVISEAAIVRLLKF